MTLEHDSKSQEKLQPEICQGRALKQHLPLITLCISSAQVSDTTGPRQVEMAAILNNHIDTSNACGPTSHKIVHGLKFLNGGTSLKSSTMVLMSADTHLFTSIPRQWSTQKRSGFKGNESNGDDGSLSQTDL